MSRLGSRFIYNHNYDGVRGGGEEGTYDVGVFKVSCHFAHPSDHSCEAFVLGKKEEKLIAQQEAQKAIVALHSKPLDLERLKDMCQPRKVVDKEKMEIEEMKKQFKP